MTKRLFLILLLISIFTYTGCGGGGGKKKKYNPPQGIIQGTVTINAPTSASYSYTTSDFTTLTKSGFFPKTTVQKTQFLQRAVPNEKIIKFRQGTTYQQAKTIVKEMGGEIIKLLYGTKDTYLISINDQNFSKSISNGFSVVEYIEDNLVFQALETPNDKYYKAPYNWNYKMLNLEKAWGLKKGEDVEPGKEVIVAVLDTGVSLSHPDLAGNLVRNLGFDYVGANDPDPSDDEYVKNNELSHGTHVAGIIGAVTNNGVGIAGVAWNVKIMPIRVLDSDGTGKLADVIEGFNHAVEKGAKIINLSLGTVGNPMDGDAESFRGIIQDAIENKKVTVVAAAGNEGGPVCFPANYGPVIAVASLDHTCSRPSYSNYGPEIDFCAPGGGVPLTKIESEWAVKTIFSTTYSKLTKADTYAYMAGTSQAAPHISGLAALLYAQNPDITPADVELRLKAGCIDLGDPGRDDYYGYGLPDAYAVLKNDSTPPEMANVKVFIGTPEGAIISNLQHVGASGDFTFSDLKAGTYYIYAFEDANNNNVVDSGEKINHIPVQLPKDGFITGANIPL